MKYVIGIDLGTSAVKVLLINQNGKVCKTVARPYPLLQEKSGYSEQDPNEWVEKTIQALSELMIGFDEVNNVEGISFSGQMHGLVLLDAEGKLLRNAILWNDTRTTKQCKDIYEIVGKERLLDITKNPALEGFTLPKLLWVREHEPTIFDQAKVFLLPKDYLCFRLTGKIQTDYSDAAGTLLLNVTEKKWSREICDLLGIDINLCPPLVEAHDFVGKITQELASRTGLPEKVKVFAGGADNACGAIGAGILSKGKTLCSIGTSGVILAYEEKDHHHDYRGKVHFFNYAKEDAFYTMGVTLAAGYSLSWFKETFAENEDFDSLLEKLGEVPIGANGLLFTPYIVGERTPHADALIRGSFIGMDVSHKRVNFVRAVIEGITFSLNESIELLRESGKEIETIISIGGGAKNDIWLQIQADVFNARIQKLSSEQGPGIGAAMLAAYGCGLYSSLEECSNAFSQPVITYEPIPSSVEKYKELFFLYRCIYHQTSELNERLSHFRK